MRRHCGRPKLVCNNRESLPFRPYFYSPQLFLVTLSRDEPSIGEPH